MKILIPIDFSPESLKALDFAMEIETRDPGKLILFHVVEFPFSPLFDTIGAEMSVLNESKIASERLEKDREKLRKLITQKDSPSFEVEYEVKIGNPYSNISQQIAKHQVDLIVMGTKGATGLEEVLVGSNTEKVVRYSPCPVISVSQDVEFSSIKKIAFATNLDGNQDFVVEELKKIQKIFNATLFIVRINTPYHFSDHLKFKEKAGEFTQKYQINNFEIDIYNSYSEEDGVIFYAEEKNVDLVAMATHGRTGFRHLLSGSIAEGVVNHSKRPVWTCNLKG